MKSWVTIVKYLRRRIGLLHTYRVKKILLYRSGRQGEKTATVSKVFHRCSLLKRTQQYGFISLTRVVGFSVTVFNTDIYIYNN